MAKREHEIGYVVPVAAPYDFAAMRFHIRFELLEIVVEILDGVLLDGVRVVAQVLEFGKLPGEGLLSMVDQASGRRVDRKL